MRNSILLITLILLFSSCMKRNFFPDEDDPGLSRLTFYGYNIATNYINDVPYINPFRGSWRGNSLPTLKRISTSSDFDTLRLSWPIERNDASDMSLSPFNDISLLTPISKSFTIYDFIALAGKRFSSNTNTVILNSNEDFGLANLYFIKITDDGKYLTFSGLFDGHMADGILITKGRFDFRISVNNINF
ncbi:MAG TPA: hypothetical protein VN722_12585 [Hanamia sp.]|nr:hypothetical protein [Hanamia sp.]